MGMITTRDGTGICYKDWGTGQLTVSSHAWPLDADAWDDQMFSMAFNTDLLSFLKDPSVE